MNHTAHPSSRPPLPQLPCKPPHHTPVTSLSLSHSLFLTHFFLHVLCVCPPPLPLPQLQLALCDPACHPPGAGRIKHWIQHSGTLLLPGWVHCWVWGLGVLSLRLATAAAPIPHGHRVDPPHLNTLCACAPVSVNFDINCEINLECH